MIVDRCRHTKLDMVNPAKVETVRRWWWVGEWSRKLAIGLDRFDLWCRGAWSAIEYWLETLWFRSWRNKLICGDNNGSCFIFFIVSNPISSRLSPLTDSADAQFLTRPRRSGLMFYFVTCVTAGMILNFVGVIAVTAEKSFFFYFVTHVKNVFDFDMWRALAGGCSQVFTTLPTFHFCSE